MKQINVFCCYNSKLKCLSLEIQGCCNIAKVGNESTSSETEKNSWGPSEEMKRILSKSNIYNYSYIPCAFYVSVIVNNS
jgi:hypothetical protein